MKERYKMDKMGKSAEPYPTLTPILKDGEKKLF